MFKNFRLLKITGISVRLFLKNSGLICEQSGLIGKFLMISDSNQINCCSMVLFVRNRLDISGIKTRENSWEESDKDKIDNNH